MNLRSLINRECFRGLSFQVCCAMLALGLVGGPTADAGIIVDINQVGADVVLNVTGTFARPGSASPNSYGTPSLLTTGGDVNGFIFDNPNGVDEFNISLVSSPAGGITKWGTGVSNPIFPSSSSLTGVNGLLGFMYDPPSGSKFSIDSNYTDNTAINGTMVFTGTTLAALNITNLGTFTYSIDGNLGSDSFVVNITGGSGAAVPEPASLIILSSVALVGGYRSFRHKSRRQVGGEVAQG